jgi:hypothetical protein
MSEIRFKNGGFPPINYCQSIESEKDLKTSKSKSKERFFSNAPRQNINIRQILSENKKKPIIIIDDSNDNDLEVVNSL